jgi:hypothetical protein
LVYPSKDQDLAYNPAFIVIGGNTLSRGLTIEGLVSTFFLRNSIQVDSLMQMGRWFGYRKGYELLPRIWLSTETLEKFKFLSALEKELQDDLFDFTLKSKKPKDFAPKVIIPKSSCLLLLTQRNKMKHAKRISLDYSDSHQQHTLFDLDQTQHNLETTQSFLTDIGGITKSRISHINTSRIWEDIDYSHIKAYLSKMRFHENSSFFNQTELLAFFEWFEKYQSDFEKWHIVLGSIQSEQNGSWPDFGVNIVHRTAKINGNKCEIKIIKDALDVICDVPQKISLPKDYKSNQAVKLIRYQNQLSNTPQLLIYRINAKDQNDQTKACKDLIAVSLLVPSIDLTDSNLKEYYQLDLNDFMEEIDNDTDE